MVEMTEDERIDAELHRVAGGTDPFAAAVRATRMPMLITDPRLPDNPIVFVNEAFRRLTGYTRDETLGRNCRFLQGPGTNAADVARIRDAINRRVGIELDLLNYRKDGTSFWNRLLISPVFDGPELTFFFASQFDITPERERLNEMTRDRETLEEEFSRRVSDLTAAEDRLRFTLAAGRLGAWTLDLANERLVASALCKANFGRAATDTFTYRDLQASIFPDDFDRWKLAVKQALEGDGDLEVDYRIVTPEGQMRWIEVRGQTRFDSNGTPMSMAGVSLDISDRKRAETHRDLLSREMSHRVKNTLATVQSIVGQSMRGEDVPRHVAANIAERLQALAGAHDVLTNAGWEAAPVREIVAAALAPFQSDGDQRIHAGGDEVTVSARAATALALALHELATNAVKYGALGNDTGVVTLNWQIEDGSFHMVWTESGGQPVEQPTRRGFGSRLINEALAGSLNGTVHLDYNPSGLTFRLETAVTNLVEPTQ